MEPKVVLVNQKNLIACKFLDKNKFVDFNDVKRIFAKVLLGALNVNKNSAKFIRDLILGFYKCGIWDCKRGNIVLTNKNNKLHVVVIDSEAPSVGGSPFCYVDSSGKKTVRAPWFYPDERVVSAGGKMGIKGFVEVVFGRDEKFKNLRESLLEFFIKFASGENLSEIFLIKKLIEFDVISNGVLQKELEVIVKK